MKRILPLLLTGLLPFAVALPARAADEKPAAEQPAKVKTQKVVWKVTGMGCESCAKKVTKSLNAIEGVKVDKVNADDEITAVTLDPAKVKKEQVIAAVEALGYEVEGERVDIPVQGMSCGACAAKVKKAIAAVEGATVEGVNPAEGKARVVLNVKKTDVKKIVAAINATGFTASEPQ